MKIDIPYGHKKITIDIPDDNVLGVIKRGRTESAGDEQKIILNALRNPVSSKSLLDLAKNKQNAVILVSDITRPCPSYKFLPLVLDELETAGIDDVRIIFGLGIHRNQTDEEKRKLVGDYVAGKARRLIDSNEGDFKLVGHTKSGTPVEVCEHALSTDLLIATSNIEYHYIAGYAGGAKSVLPGICSRRTIEANHKMMLDERSTTGNVVDNPVRQDIEEAGQIVGIDFLFNVILDDDKRIMEAVAGKNNEAHSRGIEVFNSLFEKNINEKADIVITSPGGYPKDLNLYQAQKAMDNAKGIVKENGEIILVASCPEGCGERVFEGWMADVRDFAKLNARIRERFVMGGHKAVAISKLLSKTRVLLYSNFGREETENLGFIKVTSLQHYLDERINAKPDLRIVSVPGGSFVQFKERS
jgi:nickel-dependent lactate racemase